MSRIDPLPIVEAVERRAYAAEARVVELENALREALSFIGGVAIADQHGDEWRWTLRPKLKEVLEKGEQAE